MMMGDDVDESKINFVLSMHYLISGAIERLLPQSGRGEKQSHMHVIYLW